MHVQLADESYCVGGNRVADSYLNIPAILTVAVESGAQAIHPGYGLLSENAKFVSLCEQTELAKRIDNKALSVVEQVKFEQEYLNYVIYTNPKVHESYYIVTEYKTFKESRKPYCTLHNVRTGEDIKTKITSVKIYEKQPFGLYSVLKVSEFTTQFKKKNVNGEWIVSDETEEILTEYEVIK